jgi:hypothetical protein
MGLLATNRESSNQALNAVGTDGNGDGNVLHHAHTPGTVEHHPAPDQ